MIEIILVLFGVVVVVFLINSYQNKYQSFQGVIFNVIIIALLLFLLVTFSYVYRTSKPDLTSFNGVVGFFKIYLSWVGGFFQNTGNIAGYVIKQNWTPNSTIAVK